MEPLLDTNPEGVSSIPAIKDPSTYDKGHLVFLIFLDFGTTALLPFNAYITPGGFYKAFYGYNPSITNYISFCYDLPAVFMSLVMTVWGRKWPIVPRMLGSLFIFLVSLLIIPFIHVMFGIEDMSALVDEGADLDVKNGTANDILTLFFILLAGAANGVLYPTLVQLAAVQGDLYMQAIMEGNGIGGIIPVIINIITLLCVSDPQVMAEIYFIVAAVFVVLAAVLFFMLYKIPFSMKNVQRIAPLRCCGSISPLPNAQMDSGLLRGEKAVGVITETGAPAKGTMDDDIVAENREEGTVNYVNNAIGGLAEDANNDTKIDAVPQEQELVTMNLDEKERLLDDMSAYEPTSMLATRQVHPRDVRNDDQEYDMAEYEKNFQKKPARQIFKMILLPELSVCFIFVVTLALFPATMLKMERNTNLSSDWISIIVVGVFNLVDWLGRSLPKYKFIQNAKWLTNMKLLFIYTLVRLIFVPLIVIPAAGVFSSTAYTIIIDIIFALTNGFISSMVVMKAPFMLDNERERTVGATMMTTMMNLGLTLGSVLNLAFIAIP